MKIVIFFLVLFIFANTPAYCEYSFSTTQYTPKYFYYKNYPQSFSSERKSYTPRAFNNLEKKILNHNFMAETPTQRLNRMEEATFGAIQSGDEIYRYKALQKALSSNTNSKYYSPNHNYLRQKPFFSRFTGMPTGFTPPVSVPTFEYPYDSNYNFQSGMKFRIIDD